MRYQPKKALGARSRLDGCQELLPGQLLAVRYGDFSNGRAAGGDVVFHDLRYLRLFEVVSCGVMTTIMHNHMQV